TTDKDVVRRLRLLIDGDPRRPTGISSTKEEWLAALRGVGGIREQLRQEGWPQPLFGHSGNGAHLVYGLHMPNEGESTALLAAFLQAIATRFGTDRVAIDTGVFNPSRISKLYGTVVRKGDSTEDRPHRRAALLDAPEALEPVPVELIRRAAGPVTV